MPPAASRAAAIKMSRSTSSWFEIVSRHWFLLGVIAGALALRLILPIATDVSWLLTAAEKTLDGARPYVDFLEVNPPASIWLYLPAVWLAKLAGLTPEFMTGALVFAGTFGSLWFASRIAASANLFSSAILNQLAALFAAVLLILPAQTFAQREHIALIAFMPALGIYACRASGKPVTLVHAIVAGLLAGVCVAIKPHLVFALIFAAGVAAFYARSWQIFFAIENWMTGLIAILYAALVYFLYPAFISDVLPIVSAIYVPVRASFWKFLLHFATPIFALTVVTIFVLTRTRKSTPAFAVLLAAATGFAASYYAQQKGWSYHSYPMLALIVAAAVIAFVRRWPAAGGHEIQIERFRRLGSATLIALLAGASFVWMNFAVDMRALAETISKSAPRPSILSISSDIAVGHPLTRQLGGNWVGRVCSQWIAAGALILKLETPDLASRAKLDGYESRDRKMLIEDIRRAKPDIILVDRIRFDWLAWAKADPALASELSNYRALDTINDVLILRRN
jgi:hypothetical protein